MASKNIVIGDQTYYGVPAIDVDQSGSGTARYVETSDATAVASDIADGKTAYVGGQKVTGTNQGTTPVLQQKSVNPSESQQTVQPDSGYDGLSLVTVGAIQTEEKTVTQNGVVTPTTGKYMKKVTVNVTAPTPLLQTKSATPSESAQQIRADSAYDGLEQVNISAIQTEEKTATQNGTVTPTSGKYLKKVTVNVPAPTPNLQNKTVTQNGVVTADAGYDGLGTVTVNVPSGVQTASGTVTFSQSGAQTFGTGTINIGFVPDIIFLGPLEAEGETYTAALNAINTAATLLTDNIDSNRGGFIYISTPAFTSSMNLRCIGNTWAWGSASTNGIQVPWLAIKYT